MSAWRQLHTAEDVLAAVEAGEQVEYTAYGPGGMGRANATIDMPSRTGGWAPEVGTDLEDIAQCLQCPGCMFRARPQQRPDAQPAVDGVVGLTERQHAVTLFALRRFMNEAYARATEAGQRGPAEHVAKFQNDARDAEAAIAALTAALRQPAGVPEGTRDREGTVCESAPVSMDAWQRLAVSAGTKRYAALRQPGNGGEADVLARVLNDVMTRGTGALRVSYVNPDDMRHPAPSVPCCVCGASVDTRENGTPGAELTDGRWVCSEACWDAATAATPPQPAVDGVEALAERLFNEQADNLAAPWRAQINATREYWRAQARAAIAAKESGNG